MSKPMGKRKMIAAVKYLINYMQTYPKQIGYEMYPQKVLIDDVLYGLGVAIDDKYKFATGFDEFKAVLRKHLEPPK